MFTEWQNRCLIKGLGSKSPVISKDENTVFSVCFLPYLPPGPPQDALYFWSFQSYFNSRRFGMGRC